MAGENEERRLAAILAADVAGYSRLMHADEEGTLARLNAHRRELIDGKITVHRGVLVKTTGDGMLAEFRSVVDALRCAIDIQRGLQERNATEPQERRLLFRMGLHVGDIIAQGGDIFGDGVNIAARLEGLAEPGGICVSGRVQEDTLGRIEISFDDLGEQQLKNIARPVRIYRVRLDPGTTAKDIASADPMLPPKPSIAVLPFQNMSGDPEQDYFADGMVEDIITALSRLRWLFVIARNSSFTYKGRAVDVKQIGRELGVRYVLEGSVRKVGMRVRITGQLIDASTGLHLWADRFDGTLEDVFDLQDQVTTHVVGAIAPKLEQAETERAKRKPTESLDAYDCYLRAMAKFHEETPQSNSEALGLLYRSIDLDPDYAAAHGMAAWCYARAKTNGWMSDPANETAEAARLARRAVELGEEDSVALGAAGFTLAYCARAFDEGIAAVDRALALNPNDPAAWYFSGTVRLWMGQSELALEHLAQATRLNPLDRRIAGLTGMVTAFAHFFVGRYDDACSLVEQANRQRPTFVPGMLLLAASHALAGRTTEARQALARARELRPDLRVGDLKDIPFRRTADLSRYHEGLRLAGLPET